MPRAKRFGGCHDGDMKAMILGITYSEWRGVSIMTVVSALTGPAGTVAVGGAFVGDSQPCSYQLSYFL